MTTRLAGAIAVAALGALAAVTASGIAGEDPASRPSRDRDVERVRVERVSVPAGDRAAGTDRGRPGDQKLTYFEVPDPLDVPAHTEVAVQLSKCPKGSEAVTGYFQPERPGTFLDRSRPILSTARMWAIGAFNSTDTPDQVTFGLVCLSRVK
jgi:hypothetical protein